MGKKVALADNDDIVRGIRWRLFDDHVEVSIEPEVSRALKDGSWDTDQSTRGLWCSKSSRMDKPDAMKNQEIPKSHTVIS